MYPASVSIGFVDKDAQWGACPQGAECDADFNDDFTVDILDLLAVLSNWGG